MKQTVMQATDIHERLVSGLSVRVERVDGRAWTLPVGYITIHARDCTEWRLYDHLEFGDRITFPRLSHQVLLVAELGAVANRVVLLAWSTCDACGTCAEQPVDIPVSPFQSRWRPWLARTCITCGHSWQEPLEL